MTIIWEQRKLGEISNSFSGGTPSVSVKEYYNGSIPFIRSAEINSDSTELFITENGLNNSSARLVNQGDILYAMYGATSGEVGRSKQKGAINQAILAIIPQEGYDSEFITQWLKKNKKSIVATYLQGGQGNLSARIVKNLIVDYPKYIEQQKIGQYFQRLDHLITLHQWKSKIYEMIMGITERQRKPLKIDIKMQIKVFHIVNLVYKLEIVYSFYYKIIRLRFYKVEGNNVELISFKDKCLIFIIGVVNIICFILFYHQYLMCIKILSIFVKINIFITRRR